MKQRRTVKRWQCLEKDRTGRVMKEENALEEAGKM
jgi:hypothetical protein